MDIPAAATRLQPVITRTPLQLHKRLSEKYGCNVYLKREDLQEVRSYKIRGAYNMISTASKAQLSNGVVCASAGNHAQGVAYSCKALQLQGCIFMPANTPAQKIRRVATLGGEFVQIFLSGESYDECAEAAISYCKEKGSLYVPPFDHEKIIEGQGTIALELLEDLQEIDYILVPVGGGGLAAGLTHHFRQNSPATKLIGIEPAGAASMTAAFSAGYPVKLPKIDPFIDGAAVQQVGGLTYAACKEGLDRMVTVEEGKVCAALLSLYNDDGILTEPAGALSVAAIDIIGDDIAGKNIVCIISGSNNDSNRIEEIKKLADAWEGLQHYLVIRFPHNPDGLKFFFSTLLSDSDYVNRLEYLRRDHGRSTYALVGVRSKVFKDYDDLRHRMHEHGIEFKEVDKSDFLFKYWV